MKTDVKRYYDSIDHTILLKKLNKDIADPFIWCLLVQFVKRTVERGGTFKSITCGISRGCSLSPIIAAYYLTFLDKRMEGDTRYFYRRYMDDVIVLAKTRWHLRKAVRTVNQHFSQLKVAQAPDKTFIGRIQKGFDFLGYQFGEEKLTVSTRTLHNHIRRLTQLYEQKKHQPNWKMLLDDYRQYWVVWVYSGIPSSIISFDCGTNFLRLFLKST
jgi:RNA-directed DNA polymerase